MPTKYHYYGVYVRLNSKNDLIAMMKRDVRIACFWGYNEDRIKAIESAGDRVLREKGWHYNVHKIRSR